MTAGDGPVHPGEHLAEMLAELGRSQRHLAQAMGVPPARISQIIHGRRGITADTALRLGQALAMTPEFWLNLQHIYDLDLVRAAAEVSGGDPLAVVGSQQAARQ